MSKKFFFTEDNQLINESLNLIDKFAINGIKVIILANLGNKLKALLPNDYVKRIDFINRKRETRDEIKRLKDKYFFSVVGVVDEDAIFSFNCKLPLFNPEKLLLDTGNISSKVIRYGLPIIDYKEIIDCYSSFEYHKKNYFLLNDNNYTVLSLTNANTYYRPEEEVRIKDLFRTNLKGDENIRDRHILLLLLFNLISEVTTQSDSSNVGLSNVGFENVDFWGTFPSSDPNNINTSVSFIKEAIRVIEGGLPRKGLNIFIRSKRMNPKHTTSNDERENSKCDKDFDTLIINPKVLPKLKGKCVCIIDDYITKGYSAEAAKNLLMKAGASKVIFIGFGKFGKKYHVVDYKLTGDLDKKGYDYQLISDDLHDGSDIISSYDTSSDNDLLNYDEII